MASKRLPMVTVHMPRGQAHVTGRQEGTLPKRMAGKARGERRSRKPAKVIPLVPADEPPADIPKDPRPHGDCPGCQLCIATLAEMQYGGKWKLNDRGELERITE